MFLICFIYLIINSLAQVSMRLASIMQVSLFGTVSPVERQASTSQCKSYTKSSPSPELQRRVAMFLELSSHPFTLMLPKHRHVDAPQPSKQRCQRVSSPRRHAGRCRLKSGSAESPLANGGSMTSFVPKE